MSAKRIGVMQEELAWASSGHAPSLRANCGTRSFSTPTSGQRRRSSVRYPKVGVEAAEKSCASHEQWSRIVDKRIEDNGAPADNDTAPTLAGRPDEVVAVHDREVT